MYWDVYFRKISRWSYLQNGTIIGYSKGEKKIFEGKRLKGLRGRVTCVKNGLKKTI